LTLFDLNEPGAAMAIGALPALSDGPYARDLTQEWARAIYEDNPTGFHVDGIRYRSAYNGGVALALWDSANDVTVVNDNLSVAQDFDLRDPLILGRLYAALKTRHIVVRIVSASACSEVTVQVL
jgi:hypothetical protein